MFRKILILFLAIIFVFSLFGCSNDEQEKTAASQEKLEENAKKPAEDPKDTLNNEYGYDLTAQDFLTAILVGDAEAVRLFLDGGMDPDSQSSPDWPVMYHAISANSSEIVTLLIDYGADVGYENKDGGNYLWYAVLNKAENATLDALLEGGVDLNYSYNGDNSYDAAQGQLQYDAEYQRLIDYLEEKGLKPLG